MIPIIYEDKHIIVINKPTGMPSAKDRTRAMDVKTSVEQYLVSKGEESYVGLVHRLDRPVGGLMVLAKTQQANSHLNKQIMERRISKGYLALCQGVPTKETDQLTDYLVKRHNNRSEVVPEGSSNSKKAVLTYRVERKISVNEMENLTVEIPESEQFSLLYIELLTGRHHQIRVQLSAKKLPIYGDTKYNPFFADQKGWHQISLCSVSLSIQHPTSGEMLTFTKLPDYFPVKKDYLSLPN